MSRATCYLIAMLIVALLALIGVSGCKYTPSAFADAPGLQHKATATDAPELDGSGALGALLLAGGIVTLIASRRDSK